MRLDELVEASAAVAATRSRRQKIERLAGLLRRLTPGELPVAAGFLVGEPRQGRLGLGVAALRRARAQPPAQQASLELAEVDRCFEQIADSSGPGSAGERQRLLGGLMARAVASEQDFLARLLLGELRQGALEALVVDAVAAAAGLEPGRVRRALMLLGDVRETARLALVEGAPALDALGLELFRPLQPMLAQPVEDLADAFGRLGEAAVEAKLDGARIQVHRDGEQVRVYTRGLNEVTAAVPEVVELVRALPVRQLVLDGEVLALHPDGRPRPFQQTMRRFGRRLDVEALRSELPLSPYFFDCLRLDADTLIDMPARRRLEALSAALPDALRVERLVTADPEQARRFAEQVLSHGHEGVMAKALDASYEAGKRGAAWLKLKPAHTLDLVVLAAEWGSGRRRGWLSNLHLGARDPEAGGFVMLGKTFKGLSDETLRWQTERLQQLAIGHDDWTVYVKPELVVEVAFNDVQASPHYPAGLALRFARVKRYREDKRAVEADTIDSVREIHARSLG